MTQQLQTSCSQLLSHLVGPTVVLELRVYDGALIGNDTVNIFLTEGAPPAVPIPGAVWLFGSGLLGLIGFAKRKKNA